MATSAARAACKPYIRRVNTNDLEETGTTYLNTRDTNSDVSRLNHTHVVGTISDSQKDRLLILFDKLHDESLL